MKDPIKMTHRMEYWNGSQYQRTYAYSDGSREMHNQCIWALIRDPEGLQDPDRKAYRIVLKESDRPLKPKANWATSMRRRQDDGLDLWTLAQLSADHYHSLRTRDLTTHLDPSIKTEVHVFPVKPSGRGTASEFRQMLAARLIGTTRAGEGRGSYWGKSANETRMIHEKELADHGFVFIEVDLEDYS